MDTTVRLNKFLAERLGISRRQADDLIAARRILVNDKVAVLGERIDKDDKVCYNGRIRDLGLAEKAQSLVELNGKVLIPSGVNYVYLALNKPVGYVCSRKRQGEIPTIYELLPPKYQELKTVGRLDKDSSGLILLTNDGDFAFKMTHPGFAKTKIYEVELDRGLAPLHQQMIGEFGIEIGDGVSRLGLERLETGEGDGTLQPDGSRKFWRVTMNEGRNRQIRRTFGALGYTVIKLHRVEFGKYRLAGLKDGDFVEVERIG